MTPTVGEAFSMLLGAQVNSPRFGSTGEFEAFGPWEQANGAPFYPGTYTIVQCTIVHYCTAVLLCAAQAPPHARMAVWSTLSLRNIWACIPWWYTHVPGRGVLAAAAAAAAGTGQPRIVDCDGSLRGMTGATTNRPTSLLGLPASPSQSY